MTKDQRIKLMAQFITDRGLCKEYFDFFEAKRGAIEDENRKFDTYMLKYAIVFTIGVIGGYALLFFLFL